jgi:hypothetical protein
MPRRLFEAPTTRNKRFAALPAQLMPTVGKNDCWYDMKREEASAEDAFDLCLRNARE